MLAAFGRERTRSRATSVPAPDYRPQLASLVREPPRGDQWLHEIKYDGYRMGCRVLNGRVTLISRNGQDWSANFPAIAEAASHLGVRDALLDGEVVVVLPDGRTSFQALQHASRGAPARGRTVAGVVVYVVFDLLSIDGDSLVARPVEERKARLRALLGRPRASSPIRFAAHVVGNGKAFFEQACLLGLEGVISKRRDLPYRAGRHGGWVKTKCSLRQEFVVGGFTDPAGARVGLGALLLGCYDRGRLVFAGKVGTGFTQTTALDLRARLNSLAQRASPFMPTPPGALGRTAHWVKPELVAQVAFTEWTSDGRIRHPSFQGLRTDKQARDVKREQPAPRKQ